MKFKIEFKAGTLAGPLAFKPTREALENAIATSDTLFELATVIAEIPGLVAHFSFWRIEIHSAKAGWISKRLALITVRS